MTRIVDAQTVGEAYMALRARELDARIMAAAGTPLPDDAVARTKQALKLLSDYVRTVEGT